MRVRSRPLCNCRSVKIAKNSQEGRINQCFYFDKASDKRLYIQLRGCVPDITFKTGFFKMFVGHNNRRHLQNRILVQ